MKQLKVRLERIRRLDVRGLVFGLAALMLLTSGEKGFHPDDISTDSVRSATYIQRHITYHTKYSFIDYQKNFIEWQNYQAIAPFFNALKKSQRRKVKILHLGDSHVRADVLNAVGRDKFQQIFGDGGRGIIFPYALLPGHPGLDYESRAIGRWESANALSLLPELDLGFTGVTARTKDPNAGFNIRFNKFYNTAIDNRLLKIWCKIDPASYDLKLRYGHHDKDTITINIRHGNHSPHKVFVAVELPVAPTKLDVMMLKRDTTQKFFELHGISLETPSNRGAIYHATGVNGGNFSSVLRMNLMANQLQDLDPDLLILDISGNEYYAGGLNEQDFEAKLKMTLDKLQTAIPKAALVLSCSQDIYRGYYHNVADCKRAAEIAKQVAFERGCAFYDYFTVSGGRYAMLKWQACQLAKSDRVHLTYDGYNTKGELISNALLTSYHQALLGYETLPFITERLPKATFGREVSPVAVPEPVTYTSTPLPKGKALTYVVQSGDMLGSIAERYGTSVEQLKQWNGLASHVIYPGQKLKLYGANVQPLPQTPSDITTTPQVTTPSTVRTNFAARVPRVYFVKTGDTLWSIAHDNNMTVHELKKLNNLSNDKLKPGQRLLVY